MEIMKELPLPFNFDEWDSFEDYEKILGKRNRTTSIQE